MICISYTPGQASLSFVVNSILSTATVSKLTESGLNRACTATVRSVGERFVVNWSEFSVLLATAVAAEGSWGIPSTGDPLTSRL